MSAGSWGGLIVLTFIPTICSGAQLEARLVLACRKTAPCRCAYPGGYGRIEHVHVETEINRPIFDQIANLPEDRRDSTAEEFVRRDNPVAEAGARIRTRLERLGRACSNVEGAPSVDEPFVEGAGECGRRVITVYGVGIRVCVQVHHHELRIAAGARPHFRQRDRAVASHRDRDGAIGEGKVERRLDCPIRRLNEPGVTRASPRSTTLRTSSGFCEV